MSESYVDARIANVKLRLPVYRNKQATLDLADEVSALIASMQEKAGRVDSQAFALLAAFALAAELHAERAGREQDARDLLKVLDTIATQLERLVAQRGGD
jgi:cell division protein ZapA (FtsZ GTPase activity inhibitor)